ncbi:MAG: hypothetical protein GTO05_17415, partial [Gemmatimonadales bacterium]|nr:hypothetical protein [Gemmatimonadales bacterium]
SNHLDYLWALLPETVLATAGVALLLYDGFARKRELRDLARGSLIAIALAVVANFWLMGVEEIGRTGMVAID